MFLAAWDEGQVLSGPALREAVAAELDETALADWVAESLDEADVEPVEDTSTPRTMTTSSGDLEPSCCGRERRTAQSSTPRKILSSPYCDACSTTIQSAEGRCVHLFR